jgi:Cu/Ag efflux protein CusF
MKHVTFAIALLSSIGLAQAASHEHMMDHGTQHNMASGNMADHNMQASMHQGMGVVKAVRNGKVQIAHEPIPSLEWPAMTMWFQMDSHTGHDIKAGDRVHFEMMQGEKKKWVIEKIEKQ